VGLDGRGIEEDAETLETEIGSAKSGERSEE
jgi:hypothetical protein